MGNVTFGRGQLCASRAASQRGRAVAAQGACASFAAP